MIKGFVFALVAIGLTAGVAATPPSSPPPVAAPRIIMLHGGVLAKPVYLTDWWENLDFMLAVSELATGASSTVSDSTPHIEVAMFWSNPKWEPYVRDTARLRTLDPKDAAQSRLYLGHDDLPPLLVYPGARLPRVLAPTGQKILSKYRVPTEW